MTSPLHRQLDNGNGHRLSSHWFHPAGEARGVVLIVPAMGVEQRFYATFAQWLAERGFVTVTFDYVGMGLSRQGSLRDLQVDVIGWGRHDCSAMLDAAAAAAGRSWRRKTSYRYPNWGPAAFRARKACADSDRRRRTSPRWCTAAS